MKDPNAHLYAISDEWKKAFMVYMTAPMDTPKKQLAALRERAMKAGDAMRAAMKRRAA